MLLNKTRRAWWRCPTNPPAIFVLRVFLTITIKGEENAACVTTMVLRDTQISSGCSAMESIRRDWVLIMEVHFNLSAEDIKRAKRHSLSYNLSQPRREAGSTDLQIASSAKSREKAHTHTHSHTAQLKADKHQARCHIFSRMPKVEVLISRVGLLRASSLSLLLMRLLNSY